MLDNEPKLGISLETEVLNERAKEETKLYEGVTKENVYSTKEQKKLIDELWKTVKPEKEYNSDLAMEDEKRAEEYNASRAEDWMSDYGGLNDH